MANWWFLLPNIPTTKNHSLAIEIACDKGDPRLDTLKQALNPKFYLSNSKSPVQSIDIFCAFENDGASLTQRLQDSHISEDGVTYIEINRFRKENLRNSPTRIIRQLKNKGFLEVATYLVIPNFDKPKIYLPLDQPHSLMWYLNNMIWQDTTLKAVFLSTLKWFVLRFPNTLKRFFPFFIVTATKKASPSGSKFDLAQSMPSAARQAWPALLHNGIDAGNRTILFLFAAGDRSPSQIIKLSSTVKMNHTTQNEVETKQVVLDQLAPSLKPSIPQEMGRFNYFKLQGHTESVAPGQLLTLILSNVAVSKNKKVQILKELSQWLAQFKTQTKSQTAIWSEPLIEQYLTKSFEKYQTIFGANSNVQYLFDQCLDQAHQLTGKPLPLSHTHYDFAPWNIYYQEGAFTIIDWEYDRDANLLGKGMPLYDFLYFITYWYNLVERLYTKQNEKNGFKKLFLIEPTDAIIYDVRHILESYLNSLDIDPKFTSICLVYLWSEQAIYQHKRRLKLGLIDPKNAKSGNRMVQYVDMIAESADSLF